MRPSTAEFLPRRMLISWLIPGAVLAVLVVTGGDALSQAPLQLTPPWMRAETAAPPASASPEPKPQAQTQTGTPPPPARESVRSAVGPESIESQRLGSMDTDGFGLLDATHGGFGKTMWQGTPREVVRRLLPRLPLGAPSPALHDLASRLLLSTATPPASGARGENRDNKDNKDNGEPLLPLRVQGLLSLGETKAFLDMTSALPAESVSGGVRQAKQESLLIDGNLKAACDGMETPATLPSDPFWRKNLILCQARSGARDAAFLGLDLLREQGHDDPVFHDAVWALLGAQKPALKSLPDPTPLHIAALNAAGFPPPRDVLKSRTPSIPRAVANGPASFGDLRIEAAERAEAMGAFDVQALRDLYRSVELDEKEKTAGKVNKGLAKGPRGRALLYQAALAETDPKTQAGALARALDLPAGGGFMTAARVYAPMTEALKPSPDLIAYAETVGRALYAAGKPDLAAGWLGLAREQASRSDDATRAEHTLWPLARLAQPTKGTAPLDPAVLAAWRAAQGKLSPDKLAARFHALLTLLDAGGEPVSALDWGELLEGGQMAVGKAPVGAAWTLLAQASSGGRVGETVLFTLMLVAGQDPASVDPVTLHHVITSLRRIGLEREGRALALEALVGMSQRVPEP